MDSHLTHPSTKIIATPSLVARMCSSTGTAQSLVHSPLCSYPRFQQYSSCWPSSFSCKPLIHSAWDAAISVIFSACHSDHIAPLCHLLRGLLLFTFSFLFLLSNISTACSSTAFSLFRLLIAHVAIEAAVSWLNPIFFSFVPLSAS